MATNRPPTDHPYSLSRTAIRALHKRAYEAQQADHREVCGVLIESRRRHLRLRFLHQSLRPGGWKLSRIDVDRVRQSVRPGERLMERFTLIRSVTRFQVLQTSERLVWARYSLSTMFAVAKRGCGVSTQRAGRTARSSSGYGKHRKRLSGRGGNPRCDWPLRPVGARMHVPPAQSTRSFAAARRRCDLKPSSSLRQDDRSPQIMTSLRH
jgi:hypothetical protein